VAALREVVEYQATVTVERDGVSICVKGVAAEHVSDVVRHARKSLRDAGVTHETRGGVEQIGGYSPLEVPDEDGEVEYRRRVGFF
jgi:hypothetical protein